MGYPSVISELLGLAAFAGLVAAIHYSRVALATYRNRRQYDDRLVSERGLRLPVASDYEAAIPQSVRDNPVWGSE
jgi:hypothetical protein